MRNQWVTVAETKDYNQSVGFPVRSIRIDNLTASWLYVADATYYVPPYHYGVVVNITGSDAPLLQWKTPPGIQPNPPGAGTARVDFYDDQQGASPGLLVYNQSVIAKELTTFQTTNGVFNTTPAITIPTGMQSVLILYNSSTAGLLPKATLLLPQTGAAIPFVPVNGPANSSAWVAYLPSGIRDTTFQIQHKENDAAPLTAFVNAVLTTQQATVTVESDPANPLTVNINTVTGANPANPLTVAVATIAGTAPGFTGTSMNVDVTNTPIDINLLKYLGTVVSPSNPIDVKADNVNNEQRVQFNVTTTTTLVAGVTGKTITLIGWNFSVLDAGGVFPSIGTWILWTTATHKVLAQGSYYASTSAGLISQKETYRDSDGKPPSGPAGEGLQLDVIPAGGTTQQYLGFADFTQV